MNDNQSTHTIIQTLEQKRAQKAWHFVKERVEPNVDIKAKYRTIAVKLPILIITNGLGQTLAFLLAKSEKEQSHKLIYEHLQEWLKERNIYSDSTQLIEEVIKRGVDQYRQATTEALSFLEWIKRFSEALLPEER